jgi:hypothetical protein
LLCAIIMHILSIFSFSKEIFSHNSRITTKGTTRKLQDSSLWLLYVVCWILQKKKIHFLQHEALSMLSELFLSFSVCDLISRPIYMLLIMYKATGCFKKTFITFKAYIPGDGILFPSTKRHYRRLMLLLILLYCYMFWSYGHLQAENILLARITQLTTDPFFYNIANNIVIVFYN